MGGCRIIVNPETYRPELDEQARQVRLETLLEFLESAAASVEMAFDDKMERAHSLTLVGDWFCAEAVNAQPGIGYHQTIFTRHAPSMQSRIDQFDEEFEALCDQRGWLPANSCERAIQYLRDKLNNTSTPKGPPRQSGPEPDGDATAAT